MRPIRDYEVLGGIISIIFLLSYSVYGFGMALVMIAPALLIGLSAFGTWRFIKRLRNKKIKQAI